MWTFKKYSRNVWACFERKGLLILMMEESMEGKRTVKRIRISVTDDLKKWS